MKKIKLNSSKLLLKKEKIANLTKTEMGHLFGGYVASGVCPSGVCLPTGGSQNTCQTLANVCDLNHLSIGCCASADCTNNTCQTCPSEVYTRCFTDICGPNTN